MKSLQNLSYKTLFTILFLSLAGIVFFLRIGGKTQKVSAAWWDEMWHYRKAIQINNSGANRTNIQFKLFTNYDLSSLVSSGKIQADLDDLRFTDINGNLLNYWIEDATNNSTDIWIVLNSLPNSGTTVYLYYGNSNATSGQTIMGKTPNNPGITCKAIQLSGGSDGVYYIDPTGLEATDAYQTYCDMSGNGGGWTLLMKSEGNTTTFNYNANYWTTTNTLNPNDADINQNTDAKFESFNSLLIDQIRATWPSTGHTMVETISTTTALGLFQTTVDLGPSMAQFDYTNFPYQTGYQSYGFNLTCAAANKVRWGWMFNNETTCSSNDCSAGIGLMTVYSTTNGGYVTCCSSKPNGGYPYRVRIWGRENNIVTPNVSFINTTPQSEESSTAPIAYWKFDEGVGTTVYDSAGTSNGTFTGTTFPEWQSEENCISGKCLKIQKTNSYVNTINQLSLSEITVSVWVKISSFNTLWQNIILHRGNAEGGSGFYIRAWEGGSVQWLVGNNSGSYIGINSGALTPNKWHHIVGTAKIGEPIKLYIDNKLYSGSTISSLNLGNTSDITFGRSDYAINGSIDEFKIYPYARTADQIKQDYNSRGSASSNGSSVNLGSNTNNNSLSDGLVGYWKMDEGVGTTTLDSSGNNNTGTLSGAGWTSGKYGIGTSFDGINNNIISINDSPSLSVSNITESLWVKINATTGNYQVFGWKGSTYEISMSNSRQPRFGITTTGGRSVCDASSTILNLNQWYNLTLTYNGATIKGYVDGQEVVSCQHAYPGNIVDSGTAFTLGDPTYDANGVIDEVRIYNRALSPAEVSALYNSAPGPVGYWDFDEKAGTIAEDKSGNSYDTTLTSPIWVSGKYGSALKLGGSSTASIINIDSRVRYSENITLTGWYYHKADTGGGPWSIMTNTAAPDGDGFWWHIKYPGNILYLRTEDNLHGESDGTGTPFVTSGSWYYITTIVGTNKFDIYVNGILYWSWTPNASFSWSNINSDTLYLYLGSTYGSYMDGYLDEVKLYNYARTQKQIIEDMNAGAPATSAKSMVAYYKFDEGNGATAYNSGNGGSSLNGTFGTGSSAPTWLNEGKLGKALSFNGISNYYNINDPGTNSSLDLTDNLTISAWVKKNQDSNYSVLIDKSYSNAWSWYLHGNGSMQIDAMVNGTYVSGWVLTSTNIFKRDIWQHIVWTYDGVTAKIYVNGSKQNITQKSNTGPLGINNSPIKVGIRSDNYGPFNGLIDEVKIYNYALTDEEVKQDYNAGSAIQFGSTSQSIGGTTTSLEYCIPGDTSYCASPIAEYKMDEGVGTSIVDTSGNNNTGTLVNSPVWVQGKIGKALSFNGNNNYVDFNNTSIAGATSGTVEAWVNAKNWNTSTRMTVFSSEIGPAWANLRLVLFSNFNNSLTFSVSNGTTSITDNVNTGTILSTNTWYHIVGTYDGSVVKIYVNGILKSSYNTTVTPGSFTPTKTVMGWHYGDRYFNGSIDHLKIYNYARTPAQIAYDYNKGGPIGWWKFDECQGSTAYDWSGNQNNGTINIGSGGSQNSLGTCQVGTSAAWTNGSSGKINSSLNFDGSDDYMLIPYSSVWKNKDFSASFWIKPSGSVDIETGYTSHWFYSPEGFGIVGYGGVWINNSSGRQSFSGCNFNNPNMWSHLTLTYNQDTGIGKFYVNSKLNCSISLGAGTAIPWNTSNGIYVGGTDSGSYNGPGQIDDIRIFPYALTDEQIKQIYNGGAVNFK